MRFLLGILLVGHVLAATPELMIDYVNWRGHRATRHVIARELVWGSTEWHREAQWLLRAYDVEKESERQFAVKDIRSWSCLQEGRPSSPAGEESLEKLLHVRREEIVQSGIEVDWKLDLLEQLSAFDLGRYLLFHRGLNGYWIDYLITAKSKKPFKYPLEEMICHRAPTVCARQERFAIFQAQLEARVQPGMRVASVPSGLMGELFTAKLPSEIELWGVDLDFESLLLGCQRASKTSLGEKTHFYFSDAWDLTWKEEVDLLLSNGVNIGEPDEQRIIALYNRFFEALKPGGTLMTSFFTPRECWRVERFDPVDLYLEQLIFADVVQMAPCAFFSCEKMEEFLMKAGFTDVQFLQDEAGIMPIAVAFRP
ncbi:MAG: class I SAM-dependent methyltransferase [Verrucomicrobia bacterium]|nr:class I SAM-dependent methyltransferase [Verrucomicrobiota bacterium]